MVLLTPVSASSIAKLHLKDTDEDGHQLSCRLARCQDNQAWFARLFGFVQP